MKETGARIVARTPTLAMYFSTSYLLSKCGMPVCRLAEPTEVKTRLHACCLRRGGGGGDALSCLGVRTSERRRHREERSRSFECLRDRRSVSERRRHERRPGVREQLRLA